MSKWLDLFKELTASNDLVTVSIVGIMRTGKTNLAAWFTRQFLYGWGDEGIGYYIQDNYIASLQAVTRKEKRAKHKAVAIILDDMSYSSEARDTGLAHILARIKHKLPKAKKVLTIAIYHYLTSVMPFVRLTMVRVVTSIMSTYEIQLLKEYFDLEALWDFYEHKRSNVIGHKYDALLNVMGYHTIVTPAKYPYSEPWRIVKARKQNNKDNNTIIYYKPYDDEVKIKSNITKRKAYVYVRLQKKPIIAFQIVGKNLTLTRIDGKEVPTHA